MFAPYFRRIVVSGELIKSTAFNLTVGCKKDMERRSAISYKERITVIAFVTSGMRVGFLLRISCSPCGMITLHVIRNLS